VISRLGRLYFELLYARRGDPWGFERREYERAKYERTLAALADRRFPRALEIGCSEGVFTAMLAPRCDELLAVDVSRVAIARARKRLADTPGVSLQRRTLPEDMPTGMFDLIICSEVLYYWNADLLLVALRSFESALAPGGSLLAVHGRFASRTCPLHGDDVHDLLARQTSLSRALSATEPNYRLDRYDKSPA